MEGKKKGVGEERNLSAFSPSLAHPVPFPAVRTAAQPPEGNGKGKEKREGKGLVAYPCPVPFLPSSRLLTASRGQEPASERHPKRQEKEGKETFLLFIPFAPPRP